MTERSKPQSSIDDVMKFFIYPHLPDDLQAVSAPIADLAKMMVNLLPSNSETIIELRKLVEAKDCFVRARLLGANDDQFGA